MVVPFALHFVPPKRSVVGHQEFVHAGIDDQFGHLQNGGTVTSCFGVIGGVNDVGHELSVWVVQLLGEIQRPIVFERKGPTTVRFELMMQVWYHVPNVHDDRHCRHDSSVHRRHRPSGPPTPGWR